MNIKPLSDVLDCDVDLALRMCLRDPRMGGTLRVGTPFGTCSGWPGSRLPVSQIAVGVQETASLAERCEYTIATQTIPTHKIWSLVDLPEFSLFDDPRSCQGNRP